MISYPSKHSAEM